MPERTAGHPSLLLSYYGDDFTGSTDVMEVLTGAGLQTVLFLRPPTPEDLRAYPDVRVVGVAGSSRSMSPAQMERELPPVFAALRELGAPLVHYKVCSTFDSSPEVGRIGKAIDLAQEVLHSPFVPLVVGAPALGRYCVFGNLFARSGLDSPVYRLDRHPTMRHHPATPMDESDLRLVLSRQTSRSTGLIDVTQLGGSSRAVAAALDAELADRTEIVLFDTLTEEHLRAVGEVVWSRTGGERLLFAAGSSGLEYALTAHWRARGSLPAAPPLRAGSVEQIAVASGSCSPVTERQIQWAVEQGFAGIPLRPERLVQPELAAGECDRAVEEAVRHLGRGRSVILHTSRGPEDPRIAETGRALSALGCPPAERQHRTAALLGEALGGMLREILLRSRLRRAATTGGDTSYHIARALGVEALEMLAPCAPGSPLCRVRTGDGSLDGREIVFKGGQVGRTEFFGRVLRGHG